jgi:O-antigen/teichoic acid export membrane protein
VLGMATVTISGVAALAALGLAYFDATLLGLPAVPGLVPMAVTGLVLLAVIQLSAEACRSLHELRLASLFSGGQTGGLLSNILFLTLIAAAMVLGKPSFMTAVALNLVAMCVSLPFALFALSRAARECLGTIKPRRTSSALTVRQLLAFSLPMLLIQLLTFATAQGDLWIAGICCPHDQLALYGASRRLTLLVTMPLQMLNLTVISSIAELYGQGRHRDLERLLRGAASLAAWPSLGVVVLLIVAGGPIMEIFFGPYFRQAALPLGILAVGQLFLVCAGSCSCVLAMTGHQMGSLFVNLALALVTIGTLAARHFGIVGLAVTSTGIITSQSISLWLLAKKFAGVWTHPALRPSLPSH